MGQEVICWLEYGQDKMEPQLHGLWVPFQLVWKVNKCFPEGLGRSCQEDVLAVRLSPHKMSIGVERWHKGKNVQHIRTASWLGLALALILRRTDDPEIRDNSHNIPKQSWEEENRIPLSIRSSWDRKTCRVLTLSHQDSFQYLEGEYKTRWQELPLLPLLSGYWWICCWNYLGE